MFSLSCRVVSCSVLSCRSVSCLAFRVVSCSDLSCRSVSCLACRVVSYCVVLFGPCLLKFVKRSFRYHVKRELPKHKNCERTNGEVLMIYGIVNLHNHMHFFRYLDVFTIHSGVLIPLIVLIHVT